MTEPAVIVITGPSGVGKGTLIRGLLERVPGLELSVSATTRPPRPGEQDGRDYHFLSQEEFDERLAAGEFLEHATYAGNRYGTPRSETDRAAATGASGLVLEIEIEGARQVRQALPEATRIFIAPPSLEELRTRLVGRGADSAQQIEQRGQAAEVEMEARDEFQHVVVNDRLEESVQSLADLVARIVRSP